MDEQSSDIRELSAEMIDAVSGGENRTPLQFFLTGLKQGFEEAGGTVTCFPAGNGMEVCNFKP